MPDTTTIKRILISDPDEKSRQALAHFLREKKMDVVETPDGNLSKGMRQLNGVREKGS